MFTFMMAFDGYFYLQDLAFDSQNNIYFLDFYSGLYYGYISDQGDLILYEVLPKNLGNYFYTIKFDTPINQVLY